MMDGKSGDSCLILLWTASITKCNTKLPTWYILSLTVCSSSLRTNETNAATKHFKPFLEKVQVTMYFSQQFYHTTFMNSNMNLIKPMKQITSKWIEMH
jgi:hypothetical protein